MHRKRHYNFGYQALMAHYIRPERQDEQRLNDVVAQIEGETHLAHIARTKLWKGYEWFAHHGYNGRGDA